MVWNDTSYTSMCPPSPLRWSVRPARSLSLLRELGITLVGEIASLDPALLKPLFGRRALVIHRRARGIDPTPVYPPGRAPALRQEQAFPEGENDEHRLLRALYRLVEACGRRLRERREAPLSGTLLLRYADRREVSRRVSFNGETACGRQLSLFSREPSPGEARAVLTRALDRIRARHGDRAIDYGVI